MAIPWENHNSDKRNIEVSKEGITNLNQFQLETDSDSSTKFKKINKQKEFEFIRKIIRELIEYWDDEEKILDNSREHDYDNKEDNDHVYRDDNKDHINDIRRIIPDINEIKKPTFSKFLEWLTKNNYNDLSLLVSEQIFFN
jgi:hypothetical protein